MDNVKPNFFIVGAPKCGTSAMNDYLSRHPDIFMAKKEVHYFGSDLQTRSRPTATQYLDLFRGGESKKIVGEASVWYLFSKSAAKEIMDFSPGAKILAMLRNPVDVVHALHSQHLFDANEDVADFEAALALEQARKLGQSLPRSRDYFSLPSYIDSVRFAEQLERYFSAFGRECVEVMIYDDFKKAPSEAVARALSFLGLSPMSSPDYEEINVNKRVQSQALHRALKNPAPALRRIARTLLPSRAVRHWLMSSVDRINVTPGPRRSMRAETRAALLATLTPEIQKLELLLGRDLSGWYIPKKP
jgi:hypothetical protein